MKLWRFRETDLVTYYQTAQVASQQGKYIGKKLTKLARQHKTLAENELFDDDDTTYYQPFEYYHLGSLAYIGNAVCPLPRRQKIGPLTVLTLVRVLRLHLISNAGHLQVVWYATFLSSALVMETVRLRC